MTKWIKQEDNYSCYGIVAAMITGESLQDVIDFIGYDGSEIEEDSKHPDKRKGFNISDINKYLADRKFVLGCVGVNLKLSTKGFYKEYNEFHVKIPINQPAMILVKSLNLKDCDHCLYWDGSVLIDPYLGVVEFEKYTLLEWWPVTNFNKKSN